MFEIVAVAAAGLLAAAILVCVRSCVVYIPNDKIGIVEKTWSGRGSVHAGFIALRGEAGFQPDVLRGGFHFFPPFQYRVHRQNLVTIQQGTLAYVFARDGLPMAPSQNLGCNKVAADFTDVAAFLAQGGQKGLQRKILREGTYAINLAQFVVLAQDRVYALPLPGDADADARGGIGGILAAVHDDLVTRGGFRPLVIREDKLAVVTTHEGQSLPEGTIVAPIVGADPADAARYHHDYQNPETFIDAGGYKGRQLQVLVEGTYYLNARFASWEHDSSRTKSEQACPTMIIENTRGITSPARILGVSVKALQRREREGRLRPAARTTTNRRHHTESHLRAALENIHVAGTPDTD